MKWTEIQTGKTHSAFQHFMVALGDKAEVAVERMNDDTDGFVERLATYAINGGVEPTISQTRACEIMGKNFFGIEQAVRYFGITPDQEQLEALSKISLSEKVLREKKDSHILVAVFPPSVLEVREMVKGKGLFRNQDWYNNQPFAEEKGVVGWQLVRKNPVPNSTNKTWKEQLALLAKEEVPTAQVMVYTIIGHYLATSERLFENIWVRTSSLDSDGCRVGLGDFATDGLNVDDCWDGRCFGLLAVSSSRRKS